jgi:hypothetical protein
VPLTTLNFPSIMNNLRKLTALVAALVVAPSVLAAAPTFQYKHTAKAVVVTPASSDTASPSGTGTATPVTPAQPAADAAPTPIPDPYSANVVALLHLEGSTADSSGKQAPGPTNMTYVPGKFGQAGVFGAGYVYSNSGMYALTNSTWTAEMWIYPKAVNGALMGQYGASDAQWFWSLGTNVMYFAGATFTFPNGISLNNWHHVALVRNAGVTTAYVDGVRSSVSTTSAVVMRGSGVMWGTAWFGPYPSNTFNGLIDEIRLTGGVARYTTPTFTPPAGPSAN